MGEVPEAFDAKADQTAAQLFGTAAGHTENRHFGLVLGAEALQLVDVEDLDAVDLPAHFVRRVVEGGNELIAVGIGGDEPADGLAQTAAADEDGGQAVAVAEQQILQDGEQVFDRVADALTAVHIADAVEVLPDLRGRGAHLGGQFAGRDAGDAVVLQGPQKAVVLGQAFDHRQRCFTRGVHRWFSFHPSDAGPLRPPWRSGRFKEFCTIMIHLCQSYSLSKVYSGCGECQIKWSNFFKI